MLVLNIYIAIYIITRILLVSSVRRVRLSTILIKNKLAELQIARCSWGYDQCDVCYTQSGC